MKNDEYPRVEEYGVIGDLRTTALVGNAGSIDSMCWPEFDSPSIFAAHVDRAKGGRFQIRPELEGMRQKKIYIPDTNILLSRFLASGGIAEISDFMLCDGNDGRQVLVRRAKAVHGRIRFAMLCEPRFNYARTESRLESVDSRILFHSEAPEGLTMCLSASVALDIDDDAAVAEFELEQGEHAWFVLEEYDPDAVPPTRSDRFVSDAFKRTSNFWREWIGRSNYTGRWREAVNRSALTLKLLTSIRHGSIVAAPCFGFPCEIGGERNWDYRFTWIRDAAFTLYGLMRLGFTDEAAAFMNWLQQRCSEIEDWGDLDVMYHVDGSRVEGEVTLDHLEGYRKSQPVRIGSTNVGQLQLDIFGELMDSIYLYDKYGTPISYGNWKHLTQMVKFVSRNWKKPDAGIWEIRSAKSKFLYSRVMCWVAVDRAIRLARKRSLPAPLPEWQKTRDEIYESVHRDIWNEDRQAFVQSEGNASVDAAGLVMPLVKFISPTDPRWLSTMQAINHDLVTDSLVYRYRVNSAFPDGLQGKDGTFTLCSFWLIECTARKGDLKLARFLFEKILSYGNELGLFSEQLDQDGRSLGNIPQAFTHLALISAAYDLDRRLDGELTL
ncbi:MAG: glycoside hydrolase family 15 protein [Verrucomicrobiota bacterium]